jgi:hypothetical protein
MNKILIYILIAVLLYYILRISRPVDYIPHNYETIVKRYKYYLGDFYSKSNIVVDVSKYKEFSRDRIFYYTGPNQKIDNFPIGHDLLDKISPGWWWGHNNRFNVDFPCITNSADGFESDQLPVLTKARIIDNHYNGILIKFEYDYHWKILKTFRDPYNWTNKIDSVCWRGNHIVGLTKKYNRRHFVEMYYKFYDIGFHPKKDDDYYNANSDMFKNSMTQEEQLKYKYLICIEGNDVGTSLKWQLASNSIVLMAKPIIEGWLMEGALEPFVHYVPLKDDFTDLDKMIDWCRNNDDKCKEISANARKHIEQFLDEENELLLHKMLCNWYKKNVSFFSSTN